MDLEYCTFSVVCTSRSLVHHSRGVSWTQPTVQNECVLIPQRSFSASWRWRWILTPLTRGGPLPHPEVTEEKTGENASQDCVSSSNTVFTYNAVNVTSFKARPLWTASEISWNTCWCPELPLSSLWTWRTEVLLTHFLSLAGLRAKHPYILHHLDGDFQVFKCMCCEEALWTSYW